MKLVVDGRDLNPNEIEVYVKKYKESMMRVRSRYSTILKLLPTGKYGLDYGCGWGSFTQLAREKGNKVIGQDLSSNMIEICKHVWERDDWSNLPITEFESNIFDFVISNQVIEHTHNPGNYINQINRVLKKGGDLIISLPNVMNPRFMLEPIIFRSKAGGLSKKLKVVSEETRKNYNKEHDHIMAWDPVHLVRFVSSIGFLMDDYLPLEGVPMPWLLAKKFRLPAYIYPKSRIKNYSYTMVFRFVKVSQSNVLNND